MMIVPKYIIKNKTLAKPFRPDFKRLRLFSILSMTLL